MNANHFWAAVATIAAKNFDRDALEVGHHDVALTISGTVAGEPVRQKISGELVINPPSERTREIPPKTVEVLAGLLYRLTPVMRRRVMRAIADEGIEHDEETLRLAAEIVAGSKVEKDETVRGAIAFATS